MKNVYLSAFALFLSISLTAQTTIEVQVSASEDDMEEAIDGPNQSNTVGSLDDGSSDLELGSERGDLSDPQVVGIRFANVQIPPDALILSASIQFTVDENKNTDDAQYEIVLQNDPNPPSFDASIPFNISSRTTFEAGVQWNVRGGTWLNAGDAGADQRTPDLADLVQLGIEQDGWAAGNALVFIIEGTGNKVAESFDGDPAAAPKLTVTFIETTETSSQITGTLNDVEEYIDGPLQTNTVGSIDDSSSDLELGSEQGDGGDPQLVGLRFQNIDVPSGAIITSASIQFTVDENKNMDNAQYRIRAQSDVDPPEFTTTAFDVSSRPTFDDDVLWGVQGGTWVNAGDAGPDQRTPDISDLIQLVVDQDGWAAGNALVLTIEGTGNKVAESFDGDPAAAPVLTINYVLTEQKSFAVASEDDDLEERIDGPGQTNPVGSYDVGSSDLELGSERANGDDPQLVGIRFTGVEVDQGGTVANAYIQFTVDENKSTDDAFYRIRVQDADNAEAFDTSTPGNISGRTTLESIVEWEVTGGTWVNAGDAGPDQQTPDISSLIQEIVNRPGWQSGNAIVVTIEGQGTKVAESFDGDPAAAPALVLSTFIDPNDGGDTSALFTCTDDLPEGSNREVVLDVLSTYATGVFDEGAAEITAYDPGSQRVFFTNSDANSVTILDISDPTSPMLVDDIDMSPFGGGVNSVDVRDGLVAVAVEAEESTDNGSVVLLDVNGTAINQIETGALPDMVTFSPDGTKIITANEGEPTDDYSIDPEGSVTIIDVSGGASNATATQIDFQMFNDRRASLQNKGVRIFGPGATVAQDLEPEYVTMPNDSIAYVSCQENNALIVINCRTNMIMDILALGTKDYNSGRPRLTEFVLNEIIPNFPELGTPVYDGGQPAVSLGGFSGLYFDENESTEEVLTFYMIPDRGPNDGAINRSRVTPEPPGNLRPFKLPDYQGRIVKVTLNTTTGEAAIDEEIFLTQKDGVTPISGRGNIEGFDEVPVTFADPNTAFPNVDYVDDNGEEYHALPYDPFGGDFEGIVRDNDGYFWMCDEYRPAIYHVAMDGRLIERYVPEGTAMLGTNPDTAGAFGAETLPAVYSKRRANRGFEAIAYDPDSNVVYAFIQTPLYNPSSETRNNSDVIRILGVDAADGTPVSEYVYLLERNRDPGFSLGRVDKIGDAVYVGNGTFWILERDSSVPGEDCGQKFVFSFSLVGATNILGTALSVQDTGMTLELMTADDLAAAGIQPVTKTKVLNLPSIGYLPSDKPEGIARLSDGSIAVMNDNDFGIAGAGVSDNSTLGIIQFCDDNGIDASNRSEDIDIRNWPVLSFYMPDAVKSYEIDGKSYIVTANEGDARDYDTFSEEERVGDLTLDPTAYPNAADIQVETELGRLLATTANGDYDGDGDIDQIHGYGARSFSIWDQYGNLVYDSGNEFARITANIDPDNFNSNNDDNDSRKSRSDDKGTEPEAIEVVQRGDSVYAFIGLERLGGIFVYNITDPTAAYYVTFINNRNFDVEADDPAAGDLGVEDIIFISEEESPTGEPLIVTANEVSGTVSIFGIEFDKRGFLVRLMHNNDGESKLEPQDVGGRIVGGAAPFKTAVDSLRSDGTPNLLLSSGDNFLAGIAFNASLNLPDDRSYYDAVVIDSLEYDALCLGNHDFDFGPDALERFINDVKLTQPPFLSSNLDFSQEAGLQALVDNGRIAASTVIEKDGEEFGIVGLTTPRLRTVSSPRDVIIDDNIQAAVQGEVDMLTGMGINKIILISHLQSINEELELASMLTDIDVIIAGGGDELLTNDDANAIPGVSVFGDYPLKTPDANGDTVFVVTTPGEYRYLGNLLIEFEDDGTVFEINEESDVVLIEGFAADEGIQTTVVDSIIAYQAGLDDNIIAVTEVDLDGTRESIRTMETNQGNLIADAFLWLGNRDREINGLDPSIPLVAVQNSGGIRNNNVIPANSDISERTTIDMLPFDNSMVYLEPLTPEEFKSAMENAVSAIENVDGRFLQIAGFEIVYDSTGVPGEGRIYRIKLDDGTVIVDDYNVIPGAPSLYIITNSFSANGGDDFDEFAAKEQINLGTGLYQRALFDFIIEELEGVIRAADYPEGGEGRIRERATVSTNFLELGALELNVSPNPFRTGMTIQYTLEKSQDVRFILTDMMGRVVHESTTGIQPSGAHTYRFNVPAIPTGMYSLVVQLDDKVGAIQVVKQ